MTANVMLAEVHSYLEAGMVAHIPKPFQAHEVVAALDPIFGIDATVASTTSEG